MATIEGDISRLPDGCIAHTLSLTSPLDSCRAAAVSTAFRRAADHDTVWDRFLPPDYSKILPWALQPPTFSSKKELYFRVCEPILINGGKMSFEFDRASGKKCFMISARELYIAWGGTPEYWRWIPSSDSRFSEVAELLAVCWLDIRGKMDTKVLSPKTTYCVYLVYKIAQGSDGLSLPAEASVTVGTYVSERHVYLIEQVPHAREDGWMKLEMGEFFIDEGGEGEVGINLLEVKHLHWKRGLIVQGIEVRPKK